MAVAVDIATAGAGRSCRALEGFSPRRVATVDAYRRPVGDRRWECLIIESSEALPSIHDAPAHDGTWAKYPPIRGPMAAMALFGVRMGQSPLATKP